METKLFGLAFRIPFSLILFVGALAVAAAATWAVRAFALRVGTFDHPGPRSLHEHPVPTLGGIAIAVAVLGVAWAAYLAHGPVSVLDSGPLLGLTLASIPILLLGVFDDLRGVPPIGKLAFQAVAAMILAGLVGDAAGTLAAARAASPASMIWTSTCPAQYP